MDRLHILSPRGDNYIYLLQHATNQVFVVDPGESQLVLDVLRQRSWSLTDILITHHHADHIGGVKTLKSQTDCRVWSPDPVRVPETDKVCADRQRWALGDLSLEVLATPGHTQSSVCYHVSDEDNNAWLFSGDTLFLGGCGRLFECEGADMWQSLQRLMGLPESTLVCCGHEYTVENYAFARSVCPGDPVFAAAEKRAVSQCRRGKPTVPLTLGEQCQSNIFLRSDDPQVRAALGFSSRPVNEVFTELRHRKDVF